MPTLTSEQIACWKFDGFMSPFPLLDACSLAEAQDGVCRFEAWLGSPINGHAEMKWRTMPHLLMPWAAKLAQDPRVLDVVSDLFGPDLLLFTGTFFIKEPNSPTIAAWHQDSTYYGLEPKEVVTVWIALSEASEATGCMEVVSFKGQPHQLRHKSRVVANSVNRAAQVIVEPFNDADPRPMSLEPGQFSMHHGLAPHRSGPNTSNHRRVGLAFHYTPTYARPAGTIKQAAMLVRGKDRHRHFQPVRAATNELSPEAIATHEWAVGLYRQAYLEAEAAHDRLQN
jgi:ectoine hydroxylase-related dioxygenase (phytanoyl-CoA dioxygenase family)